jgi:adenylate cyclase class IV
MKITTFNPQIIAKDGEAVAKLFEELGFEKKHNKTDFVEKGTVGIRMKNEGGFHLDISQTDKIPVPAISAIRMNVDNFEEAYEILKKYGFENFYGDKTFDSTTSKSAMMISPSKVLINLVEHIKK